MVLAPVVNHELRCIYVTIPKCACSTIRHWLLKVQRKKDALPYKPGELQCMERIHPEKFKHYQEYFWFTFLRHPLDRFLSAYKDKCLSAAPDHRHYTFTGQSLEKMLKYIQQEDSALDPHFKSQSFYLNRVPSLDFIGTVEAFETGMTYLKETIFQIPYQWEHLRLTEANVTLTQAQETCILRRYLHDFDLWNEYI